MFLYRFKIMRGREKKKKEKEKKKPLNELNEEVHLHEIDSHIPNIWPFDNHTPLLKGKRERGGRERERKKGRGELNLVILRFCCVK